MEKQWIFPEERHGEDIVRTILRSRGIVDREAAEEFLSDSPQLTYDPFLMKNMQEAVERIAAALEKGEHICIYGDYDADGVCGVSLLWEILKKLNANYSYYIPSRFDEGYGLNKEAIEKIKDRGTGLILTVDCGSVSCGEVEYAEELGLDVIVTDHHNLNDKPVSCLLINPKQEDCTYPEKGLSGCGVAFKLAQALQRTMPESLTRKDLNQTLDLVAIATVGDIVPLTGENRTLVKYGLRVINNRKRPGLSALIRGAGLKEGEIKSHQLAYVIVPHLNAGGRMFSAEAGVRVLTSAGEWECIEACEKLLENNRERKQIQEIAFVEAVTEIERNNTKGKFIVLYLADAHEGITGIVAGKLKDKYNRPVIIVTPTGDNKLKGTGRSIEGLNLYDMLSANGHLFDKFGGHAGACGFTMDSTNLKALREELLASAESRFHESPSLFHPSLSIDGVLYAGELTKELIFRLEKLEPFGHKNPKPLFALCRMILSAPCYMGERQQHVRFSAGGIPCVFFNGADCFRELYQSGSPVDLAGYPELNRWNGSEKIQFTVVDLR